MSLRRLALFVGFGIGGVMVGCGGGDSVSGPPVPAAIVVTPGADTLWTLGRTRQFAAEPRDANGNPISGVTLVWRSSNPSVATVDSVTGLVTAVGNGLSVIRAVAAGVTGQANLAVSQVVATVQVTPPNAGLTTVGVTQQFVAVAKDSGGTTVSGVRFLWISSDPSVATVDTNGVAKSKGPGQTIVTAAGRGVPGNAVLTVTQAAARLVFVAVPGAAVAGDRFGVPVQVEVRDSAGAVVAGSRDIITIAADSGPPGSLAGALTVVPFAGVATFIDVTFNGTAGTHTLKATAPGLASGASAHITVNPGAVTRMAWTGGGGTLDAVGDLQPAWTLSLYDRFDNFATNATDTLHLAVSSSPWGSHLRGPTTAVPVGGTATFVGFWTDRPGDSVRLVAMSGTDTSPPSPVFGDTLPALTEVATGGTHTCAAGGNRVFCWGGNDAGQIGNGTLAPDSVPVLVATSLGLGSISAGSSKSCALTAASAAYCWGIRIGTSVNELVPTAVPGGLTFTTLTQGDSHVCALTPAGLIYCWGDNQIGELGDGYGSGFNSLSPVPVAFGLSYTHLEAGGSSTCAILTAGGAACWGFGGFGTLGTGSTQNDSVPTGVKGGHLYRQVSVGTDHSCGIRTDSLAYCWGTNDAGQLGDSTLTTSTVPVAVFGGHKFRDIAVGFGFTCGIDDAQHVLCWGGAMLPIYDIAPIDIGVTADRVFAGISTACVLSGGVPQCWGYNVDFELGDGTRDFPIAPHPVITR